jgi:hypothetical protein
MFSTKAKPTSRGGLNKLPDEVRIQAAGTPRVLRTVEDALAMICDSASGNRSTSTMDLRQGAPSRVNQNSKITRSKNRSTATSAGH